VVAATIVHEMIRFPLPVVAALRGAVTGLGCSLAVLSDFVLLADDAVYRDPHVAVGLVAADGGAAAWPSMTSLLTAKKYLLTGDPIPASQAVALGLASEVVAAADLSAEAFALANRLALLPATALRATKRALNLHLERAVSGVLDFGLSAEAHTMRSAEHRAIISRRLERL
jgi:enoyl-CoA hydratase